MERIGLMGGTFDPVHWGHLHMARAALDGGHVDRVLFLPSGNPPHKPGAPLDKMDRYEMVRRSVEGQPGMDVCREEIDRQGVIYTVDTLGILKDKWPESRFVYLIGADTLKLLGTWRQIEEVVALCEFLVLMRPGTQEEDALLAAREWRSKGAQIAFLTAQCMDVSSTQVRARIAAGERIDDLVPPQAAAYILQHGLYGGVKR